MCIRDSSKGVPFLGICVGMQLMAERSAEHGEFGGLGWIADYPDPENFLDVLFHSESTNNQSEYMNREVDRLLEQARVEQNETVRFQLYHQLEELIVEDAPWVPLWHSNGGYILVKPNVENFFVFPLIIPKYRYVYFTD